MFDYGCVLSGWDNTRRNDIKRKEERKKERKDDGMGKEWRKETW